MTNPRRPERPDERDDDPNVQRRRLDERLLAAYLEGAEANSLRRLGRGLTSEEREGVLRRFQARHRK